MQDQTPIYYKREKLNTEPQTGKKSERNLKEWFTRSLSGMLRSFTDATNIECAGFDPTDPCFTVLYLTFASITKNLPQLVDMLRNATREETGITLYEVTALTNLSTNDLNRYRIKLVIDQEKYL